MTNSKLTCARSAWQGLGLPREGRTSVPMRMVYSPLYRSVRQTLSRATQLALDIAEEEIATDPSPGHHRRETGDGAIVDYSVEDVWIRYRRLNDEVVELERVIDLRAES
jgi:hypothetical protein